MRPIQMLLVVQQLSDDLLDRIPIVPQRDLNSPRQPYHHPFGRTPFRRRHRHPPKQTPTPLRTRSAFRTRIAFRFRRTLFPRPRPAERPSLKPQSPVRLGQLLPLCIERRDRNRFAMTKPGHRPAQPRKPRQPIPPLPNLNRIQSTTHRKDSHLRTKPNPQLTARAYNGSPGRLRHRAKVAR